MCLFPLSCVLWLTRHLKRLPCSNQSLPLVSLSLFLSFHCLCRYANSVSLGKLEDCVRTGPCFGAFVNGVLSSWAVVRGVCLQLWFVVDLRVALVLALVFMSLCVYVASPPLSHSLLRNSPQMTARLVRWARSRHSRAAAWRSPSWRTSCTLSTQRASRHTAMLTSITPPRSRSCAACSSTPSDGSTGYSPCARRHRPADRATRVQPAVFFFIHDEGWGACWV